MDSGYGDREKFTYLEDIELNLTMYVQKVVWVYFEVDWAIPWKGIQ